MTEEKSSPTSLTYRDAGVDIDAGNALVERIKSVSQATHRPEVLNGLGGFGALCAIPPAIQSRFWCREPMAWGLNYGSPWSSGFMTPLAST